MHLRLLVCAMEKEDWVTAVSNIRTILKPGGWIQWEELDVGLLATPLRSHDNSQTKALKTGFEQLSALVGQRTDRAHIRVAEAFRHAGMREVDVDVVSADRIPELRETATMVEIGVLASAQKQQIAERVPGAWSLEDSEKLVLQMEAEARTGGYTLFFMHCVRGRN